jgi:simple sugar transport system permease protein
MLNFVALYAVGWLVRGPLQEPQRIYPQSASIVRAFELPPLVPGTRVHVGVLLVVLLAVGTWWWLSRTAAGFRVRAVGLNPSAAATTGRIDVARTAALAFLLSGALAGLGGAVELTGVSYALYENLSPGYGYTAIAVALLARLHPLGVLATGLLFGALRAGATAMQRDAGVPSELVSVVEACLILFVILADQWREQAARRAVRTTGGAIGTGSRGNGTHGTGSRGDGAAIASLAAPREATT